MIPRVHRAPGLAFVAVLGTTLALGCGSSHRAVSSNTVVAIDSELRPFDAIRDGAWIGNAIAYGPNRDGKRPGGPDPSDSELLEDLEILARHWKLLRVYGATGPTERLLKIIHDEHIEMGVMLGAWIAPEVRLDAEGNTVETHPAAKAVRPV